MWFPLQPGSLGFTGSPGWGKKENRVTFSNAMKQTDREKDMSSVLSWSISRDPNLLPTKFCCCPQYIKISLWVKAQGVKSFSYRHTLHSTGWTELSRAAPYETVSACNKHLIEFLITSMSVLYKWQKTAFGYKKTRTAKIAGWLPSFFFLTR